MKKTTVIPAPLEWLLASKRQHGTEASVAAHIFAGLNPEPIIAPDGSPMAWVINTDEKSRTLFSAHLDTVHRAAGHQTLVLSNGVVTTSDGECLGADDGAGVWLLLEMIKDEVPGTFVFTVGEERGGIGAKYLANNYEQWLSSFDRAIAFDRRGIDSVITHQGWGGQCCSDKFALTLSDALNACLPDGFYCPDDTGIYTDTAEWTHIIPECTNVACGYNKEHSAQESLDLTHLLNLRDACVVIDWDALPTNRDPSKPTYEDWSSFSTHSEHNEHDIYTMRFKDIKAWVKANPESAAELLEDFAYRLVTAETGPEEGQYYDAAKWNM